MIVLNEHDWAEEMIQSQTLGKKPYETLCRVARYYIDQNGYSKKEVRKALETFLLQCEPGASIPKWDDTLDYAVSHAMKRPAVEIDRIPVTASELEKISSLSGRQVKRLAFTLLILSKYYDMANSTDTHWVNTKDTEIMKMANVNTSIRRQSLLYHMLNECGMIHFSKRVDNTNIRVLFGSGDNDDVSYYVSDLRNLGYQYMMHCGEPNYSVCENCSVTFKTKGHGRPPKYCTDCANKIKIQQSVNSVMRQRALAKNVKV